MKHIISIKALPLTAVCFNGYFRIFLRKIRCSMECFVIFVMAWCWFNATESKPQNVSCYFTDHSESLELTIIFSSSIFDSGQRNATVFVCSLYLGLAPAFLRVPPLFSFLVFIYKSVQFANSFFMVIVNF